MESVSHSLITYISSGSTVPLMHMLLALMKAMFILARSHRVTILCGLFHRCESLSDTSFKKLMDFFAKNQLFHNGLVRK